MSTVPTLPTTLAIAPAMRPLANADAVTFQGDTRKHKSPTDPRHTRRLSRDNALLALCGALMGGEKGKALVIAASKGDARACASLAIAIPGMWADASQAAELYAKHPTGEVEGDRASRTNPQAIALRAIKAATPKPAKVAKVKASKAKGNVSKQAPKRSKAQSSTVEAKA